MTSAVSIEGTERVTGVTLAGGGHIEASAVVVGIGVLADVFLAEKAGLHVDDGIVVDGRLRTSDADIFAAGDAARFPGLLSFEFVGSPASQAAIVAVTLGKRFVHRGVPRRRRAGWSAFNAARGRRTRRVSRASRSG